MAACSAASPDFLPACTTNLLTGPRSQISALRNGTKETEQKGQDELRLESSDVQPAMISSS